MNDSLDDKIINELRERFSKVFGEIPETPKEFELLRRTYESLGEKIIDNFRVMMGYISNPSVDKEKKEKYIKLIPDLLNLLEENGKDVVYLRVAYHNVLKYAYKK